MDLGAIFWAAWDKPDQRIRFISNPNVEAPKREADAIFGQLNYLKNSGVLKDWVIVIEEGHCFSHDANLGALLVEGRKFARKVILITTDYREFSGIAQAFKPRPWDSEVATNQDPPERFGVAFGRSTMITLSYSGK